MGEACSKPSLSMAFSTSAVRPSSENNFGVIRDLAICQTKRNRTAGGTRAKSWGGKSCALSALIKAAHPEKHHRISIHRGRCLNQAASVEITAGDCPIHQVCGSLNQIYEAWKAIPTKDKIC